VDTLNSLNSLKSLMFVIAPVVGATLPGVVLHLPKDDWRIGAPFYFCAALQATSLILASGHFGRERRERLAVREIV
jgi:DHA1 family tetracycline resistance protein-like MFS transporter